MCVYVFVYAWRSLGRRGTPRGGERGERGERDLFPGVMAVFQLNIPRAARETGKQGNSSRDEEPPHHTQGKGREGET